MDVLGGVVVFLLAVASVVVCVGLLMLLMSVEVPVG